MRSNDAENREGITSILNSAYEPPVEYYVIDREADKTTGERKSGRRPAGDHAPVPKTRKARARDDQQLGLVMDSGEPYNTIEEIRRWVKDWTENGYSGANPVSRELLHYWARQSITPPYYAQLEAMRTIIWLEEAGQYHAPEAHRAIRARLFEVNREYNPWGDRDGIMRIATKMATGTGKTRVMQMLITWKAANSERPLDFVAMVPNLTVKERLNELQPSQRTGYKHIVPNHLGPKVGSTRVSIINYQALRPRDTSAVERGKRMTGVAKRLINRGSKKYANSFEETPEQMIARVFRNHGERELIVINDEAHHCYTTAVRTTKASHRGGGRKSKPQPVKLTKAEQADQKHAAVWYKAIRELRNAGRLHGAVYDFSATPMYVQMPQDLANPIFPWTISDYPLIDAVESGLTKVPQVPTAHTGKADEPMLRYLFDETFKGIPDEQRIIDPSDPPPKLKHALDVMYRDYLRVEKEEWGNPTPPVMIIAAGSIEHATAIRDYIAGHEDDQGNWVDGAYEKFQNDGPDGKVPTLLVHSGVDLDEKKKDREIFSTIGKSGEPGERVRCVVSVSMLTEGWDALTVTHIVGFRPFSTQLLCEQVVGRGLRRSHFDKEPNSNRFIEERVAVIGVPFNFMHMTGRGKGGGKRQAYTVRALPERAEMEIRFPHVHRYQVTMPGDRIELDDDAVCEYTPQQSDLPEETTLEDIAGGSRVITNKTASFSEAVMIIAKRVLKHLKPRDPEDERLIRGTRLMRSTARTVEDWLKHPKVNLSDEERRNPNILLSDREVEMQIARACKRLRSDDAIIPVYADQATRGAERCGTTADVWFRSGNPLYHDTKRSHVDRAPCDSRPEVDLAAVLDTEEGVRHWVRNAGLGFHIPYTDLAGGGWRHYEPDFLAVLGERMADDGAIHLILEYKGVMDPESERKLRTTREWWLPAVNGDRKPGQPFYALAVLEQPDTIGHDLKQAVKVVVAEARQATKESK